MLVLASYSYFKSCFYAGNHVQDSPYTALCQISPLFDNHHIGLHNVFTPVEYVLESLLPSNTYKVRFSIWTPKLKAIFPNQCLQIFLCQKSFHMSVITNKKPFIIQGVFFTKNSIIYCLHQFCPFLFREIPETLD